MLLEQICLAHHTAMRQYMLAAETNNVADASAYNDAAIRLVAEFRRMSLAYKEYTAPVATKIVNVVQQQNLSENQQVAFVAGSTGSSIADSTDPPGKKTRDSEQVSKHPALLSHEPAQEFSPQSEPRAGRQTEPAVAGRADTHGPEKTPRSRAGSQALVELHGSQNGRR
jgi:hypothetical protein